MPTPPNLPAMGLNVKTKARFTRTNVSFFIAALQNWRERFIILCHGYLAYLKGNKSNLMLKNSATIFFIHCLKLIHAKLA